MVNVEESKRKVKPLWKNLDRNKKEINVNIDRDEEGNANEGKKKCLLDYSGNPFGECFNSNDFSAISVRFKKCSPFLCFINDFNLEAATHGRVQTF